MNASTDSLLSAIINMNSTSVYLQLNLSTSDFAKLQAIFLFLACFALYIAYFVALFCLDKPVDSEKNPLPPGITEDHVTIYLLMGSGMAAEDELSEEQKQKIKKYLSNLV